MTRWARSYELYRESPSSAAGGDSGPAISRGGGSDAAVRDRPVDARADRRPPRAVARPLDRQDLPLRDLAHLLDANRPQLLTVGSRAYHLTGSQVRALATIGAFRAVPKDDVLQRLRLSKTEYTDLQQQGLLAARTVSTQGDIRTIVTISQEARRLLEAHRDAPDDAPHRPQALHAGLVKPAELSHDAHLYALYEIAAADLVNHGATIERVQLDYELKRDYQAFLHRHDRDPEATVEDDRRAWADAHDLTLVDGELNLPDLRIEYRDEDGQARTLDVELVTVHYSARAIAAKRSAGFALYRHGFAPRPHLFERLV